MTILLMRKRKKNGSNILNGLNFARKVIVTQECDFLLLDELLGVVEQGIVTVEAVADILRQKDDSMQIVMTGTIMPEGLRPYADKVIKLTENTDDRKKCDLHNIYRRNKGGTNMAIFKGAGVAIVTPMHEDGSVNYEKLEEISSSFRSTTAQTLLLSCGTTGESSTMTHGEHLKTIQICNRQGGEGVFR